ncbi:glycosyltransferase [Providencia sp. PROV144]|uniref:glycosyltransferase n=1 Tax=Providencia sp. PROV144 TaxID=2949854 RepID=UPI00234AEFAC|nr:glycosyltransferase [Providencia sp. PROV144]
MKIVCFTGEKYYKDKNSQYLSSSDSFKFVENTFGAEHVYYIIGAKQEESNASGYSLNSDNVLFEIPYFRNNISVLKFILFPKNYFKLIRYFDDIINNCKNDIFWVRNPALISILFSNRLIKHNKKFISHFCADVDGISKSKYKGIKLYLSLLIEKYILKRMSVISNNKNSLSFSTGSVLSNRYKKSIYLIDVIIPNNDASLLNNRINIPPSKYYLFVGRVQKDKGIFNLVNAFSQLKTNEKLLIAGSGIDSIELKNLIDSDKKYNNIKMLGFVKKEELSSLYKNCHAVIIPSNNSYEGFPRVIIESWYHKKPVIVTNLPGIVKFAKNEYNCLIINGNNSHELLLAIKKLNDEDLYSIITSNITNNNEFTLPAYWHRIVRENVHDFISKNK